MKQQVIKEVNRIFNCDIHSKVRNNKNVSGRVAFSRYMRTYSHLKLREIGLFININHSGVYLATKTHERFYKYDREYRYMFDELTNIHPLNICQESKFNITRFNSDPYKNYLSKRKDKIKKFGK